MGPADHRRVPRLPSRCRAWVADRYGVWDGETEDVSARGCRLLTDRPLTVGTLVRLTLTSERIGEPLVLAGQVVWVEPGRPARAGLSFAGGGTAHPSPDAWVQTLQAAEHGGGDPAPGVTVLSPPAAQVEVVVAPPEPEDARPEHLAQRLGDRAEELLRAGQPRAAEVLLRRALALAPGDGRLLALLAEVPPPRDPGGS